MPDDLSAPKAARRPQAERRAATHARILEGAIACLHELGYGGATIGAVAAAAGVSKGALTYHFLTKTDLMLAVVRRVFEEDVTYYNRSLAEADPRAWLRALPRVLWAAISRPSAIAVIEIMLASRSDPELAQRLRAMQRRIDAQSFAWMQGRYAAAGVAPRLDHQALHRLCVAAARGLALEAVYMSNAAELEDSIAVLGEAVQALNPQLGAR